MKVAVVTSSISNRAGGVKDAIGNLYLNMINYNCHIVIYSYYDNEESVDFTFWNQFDLRLFSKWNPFLFSNELKSDLLNSNCDLLHIHGLWQFPHTLARSWKEKTSKPVIVSPHGMLDSYILNKHNFFKRLIKQLVFNTCVRKSIDYYHSLSLSESNSILAYDSAVPVSLIPNGVNIPNKSLLFNTKSTKKHLLYLSRIHPKKGLDILIKAFYILISEKNEIVEGWVIDIVGWGDENYVSFIKDLIFEYNLEKYINFIGPLFDFDKFQIFFNSHGYILPSHSEGLPMTVLEAWSFNLPVLITPHCNLPEGYENNAAIEISDSVESVVEGLRTFFSFNDKEREVLGNNGFNLVSNHFSWLNSSKKMFDLYSNILFNNK